jgi:sulfonate transport system substrate-binding protein
MHRFFVRFVITVCTVIGFTCTLASEVSAASLPSELSVDYADYNPLSLIIRKFNWLEHEFKPDNVSIRWVYSPASNFALKNLQDGSVSIASSAIVASVWSRATGNRIKAVYVFARPEFNALLVDRDSPIKSVAGLKGKKVAVSPGSATYFFLLRALREVGLHKYDVEIVPLPPVEGRVALEQNNVDAWAGVEPHISLSQLENGSRLLYRNWRFNNYAALIVAEDFASQYPDAVLRVIKVYERARRWALSHPDDLEQIFAKEEKIPLQVARLLLSKCDLFNPVIDRSDILALRDATTVMKDEKSVSPDTNLDQVINDLIDRSFASKALFAPEHHDH